MRRIICSFFILTFVFIILGCETNKTRVGEGAGIGAAIGAIAGGVIGNQSGNAVGGALIGGALGGAGGAAVGAQINKPTTAQNTQAQPAAGQITIQQIVELTKLGESGDEIISKIKSTNSSYALTADDITYLRKQGVSQRVIETMQAAK